MLTNIDHLIVAVDDPDSAADQLRDELGLVASGGGRHKAHGTHNRLFWFGDSYLELMGVFNRARAEQSWWGRQVIGGLGGRLPSGPGRYAGVVLATDDVVADADRLRGIGSTLGDVSADERQRPDGEAVRWRTARPLAPDPELGLMFLIEHDATGAEWRAEDRAARAEISMPGRGTVRLVRVEIGVTNVARASMRLVKDFGLQFRPSLAGGGARDTTIGPQTLRLKPSRPGAPPTIVLRVKGQPVSVEVLGVRWELVAG